VDLTSSQEAGDARVAIQTAIDNLTKIGGGRVQIPAGEWYIAGPLRLTSNINLHLEDGAILRFSDDPDDYLPAVLTRWEGTELFGYSPLIYAYHAHNIAITGKGTIHGNRSSKGSDWEWNQGSQQKRLRAMGRDGEPVQDRLFGKRGMLQPSLIQFFGCSTAMIDGVTTKDAPLWGIHLVYSSDITVRNVHVDSFASNNDGIDVDSSYRVLIEKCSFKTGDDCIAIKSGRDLDGRYIATPSEKIVIRECTMETSKSAGIAIGSEMSGGIRDVFIHGCTMGTVDTVIDVKSNLDRGGMVERIRAWDINVEQCGTVLEVTTAYHSYAGGEFPPLIKDIELARVSIKQARRGVVIRGNPRAPIQDVQVSHLIIKECAIPAEISHAERVSARGCSFTL
jgi:polygalacturonase